jgi:hypothetical protein
MGDNEESDEKILKASTGETNQIRNKRELDNMGASIPKKKVEKKD